LAHDAEERFCRWPVLQRLDTAFDLLVACVLGDLNLGPALSVSDPVNTPKPHAASVSITML
jgi:hypothetical protein